MKKTSKRQYVKKFKPFDTQHGYSIDINIDNYKTTVILMQMIIIKYLRHFIYIFL